MKKIWILAAVLFGVAVLAALTAAQSQKPVNQVVPNVQTPGVVTTAFPKITSVDTDCVGIAHCPLNVWGKNFGATRGSRRFLYDGKEPASYSWQDNAISFTPDQSTLFWPNHHTFVITNTLGKAISNTFETVFLYRWDVVNPSHGTPGTEIQAMLWDSAPQAGKSLWMGSTPMVIHYWPPADYQAIRAVVPNLPAGTYQMTMHYGAQVISVTQSFKID
jgi:hypothetical protein